MDGGLQDYLDVFARGDGLTAATTPAQTGLAKVSVLDAQGILEANGIRVVKDGLYGPNTRTAWQKLASSRRLNPAFDRAGPREAWVSPETWTALRPKAEIPYWSAAAQPQPAPAPAPAPSTGRYVPFTTMPTARGTATSITVLEAQKLLNALGWSTKQVKPDGLFGPATRGAWEQSAKKRGVPTRFERVDGKTAQVDPVTVAKFRADLAAKKVEPTPRPFAPSIPKTPTPKPGTVQKSVLELQELLYGVGWTAARLKKDGLYGPQTKRAWSISAKLRNMPELFERVDGKTAQVAEATYVRIKADAKPVPAPTPTPPKPSPPKPTGATVAHPVLELQNLLQALGWKQTEVKADGLFGPRTRAAWKASATKRGIDATFERVDGRTALVNQVTYLTFKSEVEAKKKPRPIPGPAPKPAPKPRPTITLAVFEAQDILRGLREPADRDGLYGPKTKAMWAKVAKARQLDQTFERVDGRTARANADTVARLKAEIAKAPLPGAACGSLGPGYGDKCEGKTFQECMSSAGANVGYQARCAEAYKIPGRPAPPVPDVADIRVSEAQDILNRLGQKLKPDGLYGPATRRAWEKEATRRKLDPGVSRIDGTTMRVASDTLSKLKAAASGVAPVPTPPTPPKFKTREIDAFVSASNRTVTVREVQQFFIFAKKPGVRETGSWDAATEAAFLNLFTGATTQALVKAALPKLLSPDNKVLRVMPDMADAIQRGAQLFRERPVPPTPGPPEPPLVNGAGPVVPPPITPPAPLPPGPPGPPEPPFVPYEPPPAPPPAPVPEPPVPTAEVDTSSWDRLVDVLEKFGNAAPQYAGAIDAAVATGGTLRPEVKSAYDEWLGAAERVKSRAVQLIEQSSQLQQAIDQSAGSAGFSGVGLSELEAYFEQVVSVVPKVLDLLRAPVGGEAAAPVMQGWGFGQAAQVAGWAARFAGTAWRGLLSLLRTRAVTVAGGTAIAASAVKDMVNADTQAYLDTDAKLQKLVAEGALTVEEYAKLRPAPPTGTGLGGLLVLGGVALGGWWLYSQSRKRGETGGRYATR